MMYVFLQASAKQTKGTVVSEWKTEEESQL